MHTKLSRGDISGIVKEFKDNVQYVFEKGKKLGYENGYKDGVKNMEVNNAPDDEYIRQARNEARAETWEMMRKIASANGGYTIDEIIEIFGAYEDIACILNKYTADEVLAKIHVWEKGKEEFRIGDEVVDDNGLGSRWVVIREPYKIESFTFITAWNGGRFISNKNVKDIQKTGRHFPQIGEVLEQMREV